MGKVEELKTSNEWAMEDWFKFVIYDPDGWDRSNYHFSWYQERISKREFRK
ncbi:MAG: hypothetical protein GY718_01895, partial [Lentisphaerae bacterium]|nr:hypothetical protein [Lentisphaerota bacterium]